MFVALLRDVFFLVFVFNFSLDCWFITELSTDEPGENSASFNFFFQGGVFVICGIVGVCLGGFFVLDAATVSGDSNFLFPLVVSFVEDFCWCWCLCWGCWGLDVIFLLECG